MSDTLQRVADGIYKLRGRFYHRPYLPSGNRTTRALSGRTLKAAKINYNLATVNGVKSSITIGEAIQLYRQAHCPDKKRNPRTGPRLTEELARCDTLFKYWRSTQCSQLTAAMLDDFADWRMKHRKRGSHGGRAADLDIITLKNVLRWVTRRGLLATDPFQAITVSAYRKPNVRHCREVAPRSGDELHDLARYLFEDHRSAILGWLTLLTAMIGCRISEMLALRKDAQAEQPGSLADNILWVRRKKGGANNFFHLHPVLCETLAHFETWRRHQKLAVRNSPWWFPGKNPSQPIKAGSLTHALSRVGKLLLKQPRTAHGLRSFYVTCRRSQGASDAQIALETGQISGGREIVRTYGDATPKKISWLPSEGPPAWSVLHQFYTSAKRIKPGPKNVLRVKIHRRHRPKSLNTALSQNAII